jgi:hypothetical protein
MLFVRQVAEFRLDDAIHDHGRPEACPQSEEQHFTSLVTAQGLHGRVVYKPYGTP